MVYASIDVMALRECADRIRQHITTLEAHEEDETGARRLTTGAAVDTRETTEPENPLGPFRSHRSSMVSLFDRKSISSVSVQRLHSSRTPVETDDDFDSQEGSSSGSEDDFLDFHPSELHHIDENFELGISRQQVNQLLAALRADERVHLTEGIADWFSKAVTGSEAIEVELSQHELTCIQDELNIEEAHRVLGSHLQSRDVTTINHMKRFFSRVEEFRPRKPLKRSTQTRLTQKFSRPLPKLDRTVSFQTTTSDGADAGPPAPATVPTAAVAPLTAGDIAAPASPLVGIGGLPQPLTPMGPGMSLPATPASRGSFDNLPNANAPDVGMEPQEEEEEVAEAEADVEDDDEKKRQQEEDDWAGVVVSDLLEVIAMQQDEISHFKTRNDLTAKGNESIRIALEHVRNTDDEDDELEASSQSFSRSGPVPLAKRRQQREVSRGLPEAVRAVVKDMRENLQVKVLSELLMSEDGREHLKGAEANNPTIGTMVRQAALLHEVSALKEQVKEVEEELRELRSPAERVEALRQQIDARQTEIQRARDDWQRRKNALANVQEAIEAEKRRSESNQGSQQVAPGPDAPVAEPKPPEGPKPLNFTWILQAPDDVMQVVDKSTSQVEQGLHELFEKCTRLATAVTAAKKRAEEAEKKRLVDLAKQEEQIEERQLRDFLRKATAATHHFEEEKKQQKVLETEEKQLKVDIKRLQGAERAALAKAAKAEKQKVKGAKKKKNAKDGADSDGAPARVHHMEVEKMKTEVESTKAEVDRLQARHDNLVALVERLHGTRSTLDSELPHAMHLSHQLGTSFRRTSELLQGHRSSVSELLVPGAWTPSSRRGSVPVSPSTSLRHVASPAGAGGVTPELQHALPAVDSAPAVQDSPITRHSALDGSAADMDLAPNLAPAFDQSGSVESKAGDTAASPPPPLALTLQSGPGTPSGSAPTTPSRGTRPPQLERLGTRESPRGTSASQTPTGTRSHLEPPAAPTPQALLKLHDSGLGGSTASRPSTAGQQTANPAGPTSSPGPGAQPTMGPDLRPPPLADAQHRDQPPAGAAEGPLSSASASPASRPTTGPQMLPPSPAEVHQGDQQRAWSAEGPSAPPAQAPATAVAASADSKVAETSPAQQGSVPAQEPGPEPAPGVRQPRRLKSKTVDEAGRQIQELLAIQHQHERMARQIALVEGKIRQAKDKIQGRKHNKEEAAAAAAARHHRPLVVVKPTFVPEENRTMRREVGAKQRELNFFRALWWSKKSGPKPVTPLKAQAEAAAKLLLMLPLEDVEPASSSHQKATAAATRPGKTGRILVEDVQEEEEKGGLDHDFGEVVEGGGTGDEDEADELKSEEEHLFDSEGSEEELGEESKPEEKLREKKGRGGKGSTWPFGEKQLAKTVVQARPRQSHIKDPMSRSWLGLEILSGSGGVDKPHTPAAMEVAGGQLKSRRQVESAMDASRPSEGQTQTQTHRGRAPLGSRRRSSEESSASPRVSSSVGRVRSPAEQFERVLEGSGLLGRRSGTARSDAAGSARPTATPGASPRKRRSSFSGPGPARRGSAAKSEANESAFARRGSWGGRQTSARRAPSSALQEAFTVSAAGRPQQMSAPTEKAPLLLPVSSAEEDLSSPSLSSSEEALPLPAPSSVEEAPPVPPFFSPEEAPRLLPSSSSEEPA